MNDKLKKLTLFSAINFVIANMVGTGVFTSLGFQLIDIKNPAALLILWAIGGVMALFGSFVYGELGAAMPRSGGEYNFLSKIYNPFLGFLAGWVSITIGFAAPVAAACIAFGKYYNMAIDKISAMADVSWLQATPMVAGLIVLCIITIVHSTSGFAAPVAAACIAFGKYYNMAIDKISAMADVSWLQATPMVAGLIVLCIITIVHSTSVRAGGRFQNIFTVLKILFIVIFIIAGIFFMPEKQNISFLVSSETGFDILKPEFAVCLVFVSYAYSGWNASAYFVNDLKNPIKQLPRSLIIGTLVVTVLYVLLNFVFLISTPMAELEGNPEIGLISAIYIFGEKLGVLMGIFIALLLISSISSMVFAGPRVSMSMGEDFKLINVLAKKNKNGIPWVAMLVQFFISLILIITSTFESLITYTGFVLNIFTFFTVFGLFIHRKRNPNSKNLAKTWGYPITPIIFLIFNLWITIFVIYSRPKESLLGFVTLLIGAIFYYFCNKSNKKI